MICEKTVRKFCSEELSLIENYNDAINSHKKWDCHHRLETDEGLSKQKLIDTGRYYGVEAKYLIFLKHDEHIRLHQSIHSNFNNNGPWNKGKHLSDEDKKKKSEIKKGKKFSDVHKQNMRKPHKSYKKHKWVTPTGEIIEMSKSIVKRYHPDWTFLE